MSQELLKSFVLKIAAISLVASVAWVMVVSPHVKRTRDISVSHTIQVADIERGEQSMKQFGEQLEIAITRMSTVQHELAAQLDVHKELNIHEQLQEAAEAAQLTVSRIEPLGSRVSKHINELDQSEISLQSTEYRIECEGSFSGIVDFLHDLQNGPNITKANSLRILPVSSDHARMIVQITTYQLTQVPDSFLASVDQLSVANTLQGEHHGE